MSTLWSSERLTELERALLDRMRAALDLAFIGQATPDTWRTLFEGLAAVDRMLAVRADRERQNAEVAAHYRTAHERAVNDLAAIREAGK